MASLAGFMDTAFLRPSALAFASATLWGFLSVVLSPCHLGSIPLIVAYINHGNRPARSRALSYSLLFAGGLLVTLAAIGCATSAAGRLLGDVGPAARVIFAILLIVCGLWLMDVPPFSKIGLTLSAQPDRRGPVGALTLGLVYGVILGPCSFAFLAPMLGFVFSAGRDEISYGVLLMCFYAVGHTLAIVAAGTFGDYISVLLKSHGTGTAATWFKRALGAIVAMSGLIQIIA
jgi:cytochrome c-type biogenesis protein